MNEMIQRLSLSVLIGAALLGASGCAAFRAKTTEVDPTQPRHISQRYDYTDMLKVSDALSSKLLASPFMTRQAEAPVMMVAGIQNRTDRYEDMKNLSDRIRNECLKTGKVRFINEARRDDLLKEQGYQAANATPESMVQAGRQLGAKYMITGSLTLMKQETPRQVRVSKTLTNYYKITLEVTDLTTGEIVWTEEEQFARDARLPLFGW